MWGRFIPKFWLSACESHTGSHEGIAFIKIGALIRVAALAVQYPENLIIGLFKASTSPIHRPQRRTASLIADGIRTFYQTFPITTDFKKRDLIRFTCERTGKRQQEARKMNVLMSFIKMHITFELSGAPWGVRL